MNRLGLGLAVGAGYVLGRTKKMKLAFAVGTLVAGKRMQLSPRALADLVSQQLQNNPQFKEIGEQLREDLRGVGKAASGAMVERQMEGIAGRLHGRTAQVRDRISGVAPDVPGLGGDDDEESDEARDENSEETEETEGTEEAEDRSSQDKGSRPRRKTAAKTAAADRRGGRTEAKKTAKKTASAGPGKKTAGKTAGKTTAKKTTARKTAGRKTTAAKGAARGAARTARTARGGDNE
ncbi:DNA primase [Streptomyces sp. NPDC005485]|uniref:DNA primase n=1 Tax=Streptomyces sp. NPDC005485 TaxID=3155591 RepID=UPI0033A5081C